MSQTDPQFNPYSTPAMTDAYNPVRGVPGRSGEDGFVKQVPVIGVLMMVQGGLELVMGLVWVAAAVVMIYAMLNDGSANPPPREAAWLVGGAYGGFALCVMMAGILRMFAGYRIQQFRSRIFGIVANILGFGTLLTCNCSVTSLGLGIWSLIVLLQASVISAFEMKQATQAK